MSGGPEVPNLRDQLIEAEATAEALRRQIAAADCAEVGHDWRFIGGRNAACSLDDDCACSVPVHACRKCKDCDFGDNAEADSIRDRCDLDRRRP